MNAMLKALDKGYQNVLLVSDDGSAVEQLSDQANVRKDHICRFGRTKFLSHYMDDKNSADLLVIDVDAFGMEDGLYMLFLAKCMLESTPVIILASDLPAIDHQRFLSAGALEVLSRAGTRRVLPVAA